MGSRVQLYADIRHDARVDGLSIRELARKHGVHRRTVRQALAAAEPPPRKKPVRTAPRLDPYKPAIDEMLTYDLTAPRKQRHTATRILARLRDEHGATDLSYSTVRDYVRVRRAQIDLEAGRRVEAMVPQDHAPGAEAEVDFGEVYVILDGVKTKCHMFVYRLSHSGKAIHRVYPTGGQEAFLEGHIEAFHALGGIPTRHIRYDNLTSAVVQVIHGGDRLRDENERWVLFRSHYGFDAFYCQPGIDGAHEKGGVEGEVGWFRRNHLTPMPEVATLDELNDKIRAWEHDDNTRRITGHANTIGQDHHAELPHLAPLPADDFDPGLILHPRVDRSALITVRMVKYSVPAHLIGQRVRVSLRASCVVVFEGRTVLATHPRLGTRGVTRPLPRSAAAQARRVPRLHRPRAGPRRRSIHRGPRRVLGRGPQDQRRRGRDPSVDRRAPAPPIPPVRRGDRRHHLGPVGGRDQPRRRRRRSPPPCHHPHTRPSQPDQGRDGREPATPTPHQPAPGHRAPARRHPAPAHRHRLRRTPVPTPTRSRPGPRRDSPPHPDRNPMTTTSTSRPESLRRRQGLTEQAAQAAIGQACRRLRLPTIRAVVDDAVTAATKEQLTYQGFLAELLLAEVDDRDRRSTLRRIKSAGFPREKWLADFDFTANPNINPATINELATGDWIRRGDPLCLIGDSGTGKSHLLIALGTAAAEQGYRVRYTLATRLVNELVEAADEKQLTKTINRYGRVDLLVIDELGYLELDRRGAELLFQVLTEREEKNAIAIASNQSFSAWTDTFTDPRLCAAIVDRLTYNATIIETGTNSYRLAHTRARASVMG